MKSRLRITLLVLCIVFSTLLISCSYTSRSVGNWGPWGGWKQEGTTESRSIHIKSKPEGARVYINGTLAGDTPVNVSLSCPLLKSERARTHYESFTPGVIEYLLLFSRPKTSPVSSEKEERTRTGGQTYLVEVRKEGYISSKRSFSVHETSSLDFTLKRKPTLAIKSFKIKNNVNLSIAERVFDFIYGRYSRRFSVDDSKFKDMSRRLLHPALIDVFEVSAGRDTEYALEGEMIIEKKLTELGMVIVDNLGRVVAARKAVINTKELETLPIKMESLIREMVESFLNRY